VYTASIPTPPSGSAAGRAAAPAGCVAMPPLASSAASALSARASLGASRLRFAAAARALRPAAQPAQAAMKVCSKRSTVKSATLHALDGKADAVREMCKAHMAAVLTMKVRLLGLRGRPGLPAWRKRLEEGQTTLS